MEPINLFELFAKITLDTGEYEEGLNSASASTTSFADKLKSGLSSAAKVGAAAIGAAATGIAAITKASLDNYAEYEQLVGGVETLFQQSADVVQQYADNAYKTAGMSANEYMDTVTSFSASLLQGLGGDTALAAEVANQAITDMSDNANKMGTDMSLIQNAYQGFAKQNYTMLDNLKLGYGGTQEEMVRLINDSGILNETISDLDNISFDQIIEAIHVVQTNMGITGTTAKEAATTIEGSVASMRSAWKNLLTGLGNENADIEGLIENLADSVETAAGNIIPRVEKILSGIGDAIEQLAPLIGEKLPEMIVQVLPSMISAGAQLLIGLTQGIMTALPQLMEAIPQIVTTIGTSLMEQGPAILEMGGQMLLQLANGIITYVPQMVEQLPTIITEFVNFISGQLPTILQQGTQLLNEFVNGIIGAIPTLVSNLPQVITAFVEFITTNLPTIIQSGIDILTNLIEGIISAIPDLVAALPQIVNAIVDGIGALMGSIVDIGKNIVQGIWQGIQSLAGWIKNKVTGFFSGIVNGAKSLLGIASPSKVFADEIGANMALGVGEGWDDEYDKVRKAIEGDMDFGTANVDFASTGFGQSTARMRSALNSMATSFNQNATIVVQSVLDGKVIGETAYKYSRNKQRAYGV